MPSRGAQGRPTDRPSSRKAGHPPAGPPAEGDKTASPVKAEEVALPSSFLVCGDDSVGAGGTAVHSASGGRNKRKSPTSASPSPTYPGCAASGEHRSSGSSSSNRRRCTRSRQAAADDVVVLEPDDLGTATRELPGRMSRLSPRTSRACLRGVSHFQLQHCFCVVVVFLLFAVIWVYYCRPCILPAEARITRN